MVFATVGDWLILGLIAVLTATMLMRIYVKRRSLSGDRTDGRRFQPTRGIGQPTQKKSWTPTADSIAARSDIPDAVARWELHLEERGRAIAAEVDSKLRLLQVYVSEADRVSSRLEAILERLESTAERSNDPGTERVFDLSVAPESIESGRLPSRAARGVDGSGTSAGEVKDPQMITQIGVLWDYGFGIHDIASRMGLTGDQVKEALGARKTG